MMLETLLERTRELAADAAGDLNFSGAPSDSDLNVLLAASGHLRACADPGGDPNAESEGACRIGGLGDHSTILKSIERIADELQLVTEDQDKRTLTSQLIEALKDVGLASSASEAVEAFRCLAGEAFENGSSRAMIFLNGSRSEVDPIVGEVIDNAAIRALQGSKKQPSSLKASVYGETEGVDKFRLRLALDYLAGSEKPHALRVIVETLEDDDKDYAVYQEIKKILTELLRQPDWQNKCSRAKVNLRQTAIEILNDGPSLFDRISTIGAFLKSPFLEARYISSHARGLEHRRLAARAVLEIIGSAAEKEALRYLDFAQELPFRELFIEDSDPASAEG
jgi:hypothetical protein